MKIDTLFYLLLETTTSKFEAETISTASKCSGGEKKQNDVIGCGGGIDIKCTGGCLRIFQLLYSCKEQKTSNREQLRKVRALCRKKENCRVEASRDFFGNTECPDSPDRDMVMWIVYSCNGGKDETKLTGPDKCPGTIQPIPILTNLPNKTATLGCNFYV